MWVLFWLYLKFLLKQLSEEREVKAVVNIVNSPNTPKSPHPIHSVVNVEDQGAFSRTAIDGYQASSNRRVFQDIRDVKEVGFDHDDDKYKRRPASELVRTWWRQVYFIFDFICYIVFIFFRITWGAPSKVRGGKSLYKKYCMLGIILVLGVVVFMLIMSRLGRYSTENDPNFDIRNNPNVHVQHVQALD